MQLSNMIQCVLALLSDRLRQNVGSNGDIEEGYTPKVRIVDFAGGTGHLAVPLALLLPQCQVVCVDLKKKSLDLLHRRVDGRVDSRGDNYYNKIENENNHHFNKQPQNNQYNDKLPYKSNTIKTSHILPNLSTYHGSIQSYPHAFDIGVSLHACGEASDWTLRKCLSQTASGVICSCCCGKLQREAGDPYVFQSTGRNEKGIVYPQSRVFACLGRCKEGGGEGKDGGCNETSLAHNDCGNNSSNVEIHHSSNQHRIMTAEMFDELARAADYSELGDVRKARNACRRAAKSLVEWDRLLFAKEYMQCNNGEIDSERRNVGNGHDGSMGKDNPYGKGGNAVLTRMSPWEATCKNDILIGWFHPSSNPYHQIPPEDLSCYADFEIALQHLFGSSARNNGKSNAIYCDDRCANSNNEHAVAPSIVGKYRSTTAYHFGSDQNDWTALEEAEIRSKLEEFLLRSKQFAEGETVNVEDNSDGEKRSTVWDERVRSITNNNNDGREVLRFPTGMGSRKRKLVHYVAELMGLVHWGEGKLDSEKIVAVAYHRRITGVIGRGHSEKWCSNCIDELKFG